MRPLKSHQQGQRILPRRERDNFHHPPHNLTDEAVAPHRLRFAGPLHLALSPRRLALLSLLALAPRLLAVLFLPALAHQPQLALFHLARLALARQLRPVPALPFLDPLSLDLRPLGLLSRLTLDLPALDPPFRPALVPLALGLPSRPTLDLLALDLPFLEPLAPLALDPLFLKPLVPCLSIQSFEIEYHGALAF